MVTVTTVGYGDFYPTSPVGKLIGAVTVIVGILTLALPITIISTNYSSEVASQQAEKNKQEVEAENALKRKAVFGKSSAARRATIVREQERRGDPTRILTLLSEVNAVHPWGVLALMETEIKTLVESRKHAAGESKLDREMALDRFHFQMLSLLRMHSPLTSAEITKIRTELVSFYAAW